MTKTIAIALSGGVDSLVSAHLLKQQGYRIIGLHFTTGYEPGIPAIDDDAAAEPVSEPLPLLKKEMSQLGKRLHIPIEIIDISKEFKQQVVDYFIHTYGCGKTPNPCMVCNASIKFGVLLDIAENLGANRLATGHYAKIARNEKGEYHLKKGVDPVKDQSYFLARLNRSQLASAIFPLGELTKSQVVSLAKQERLFPLFRSESQDVCFIRDKTYGDFLSREAGIKNAPGPIIDINGNLLGEHQGLHRFTIGQRRGINCPAKEPYYVIRIEPEQNRLVVGFKRHLLLSDFTVCDINWIGKKPSSPRKVMTRVRYRHKAAGSVLTPMGDGNRAHVRFLRPQTSITPGQGAVFYQDDEVLGGGWIER